MDKEEHLREGRSLSETPNWAVATVITVILTLGFFFHGFLKKLGKWLDKTKRKALLAALEKIRDELMLFGLLSLLMGHWIHFVAKICVKKSAISSTFYPCASKEELLRTGEHVLSSTSNYLNNTFVRVEVATTRHHGYCPEGHESFASYESLEQLHRFVFVLGVTHVLYSFIAIALAMIKIYSWRIWENQAKAMAVQSIQDSSEASSNNRRIMRVTTFVFHQASHPWSQHKVLVWLLCFSRQCWSSIHRSDYMALRLGFITTHQLPLTYDFHNYMLRSMEEEFCDIVGISIPLWIYAIFCIILNFHGTNVYFWLSFLPAILILLIGTKLHRVVVKLAVEIMDNCPWTENHQFNLRDDLFWFGKPRLLLRLIQLISFQNALEMASFIWSLWEIKEPSCFMENRRFLVVRLAFGIISQFWCSFITFPLYVIITQMGSRFKRSVVSENVRIGLSKWQKRVKGKRKRDETSNKISTALLLDSKVEEGSDEFDDCVSSSKERRSAASEDDSVSSSKERRSAASEDALPAYDDKLEEPFCLGSQHDSYSYSRCYRDYRVDVENDDIF